MNRDDYRSEEGLDLSETCAGAGFSGRRAICTEGV